MKLAFRSVIAGALGLLTLGGLSAADWPAFRGSEGGVADDTSLPVQWTKDDILWKVKLPGPGASSPITYGDKVFLTAYSGYGMKISRGFSGGGGRPGGGRPGGFSGRPGGFGGQGGNAGDPKKLRLHVLCLDGADGKIVWTKDVEPKLPEVPFSGFITEHGYASSTPVTDGQRVYAFFGKTGVVALDMDGKQLWQVGVGTGTDKWGSASSPVLAGDVLVVYAGIESGSLVGLDKKSGKELWRVKGMGVNWVSPLVVETKDGKQEVVLSLVGKVAAYDPRTGEELWHCRGIPGGKYTIATPVARDGVVYVVGGGGPGSQPTALAIKAGGRGAVDDTHVLWRKSSGTSISSPVLSGDHLCWVAGTASCLNATNGKEVYQERVYDGRGEYVSPVVAGDRIYALTRLHGLYVLAGGGDFKTLAHFEFEGDESIFNASPAVSDGRIYLRSNAYLYCVGKKSAQ